MTEPHVGMMGLLKMHSIHMNDKRGSWVLPDGVLDDMGI